MRQLNAEDEEDRSMESSLWRQYVLIDLETGDCFDSADVIGQGLFQRKIEFLAVVSLAILFSEIRVLTVISSPVDHWCKPPARFSHLSQAAWKNIGIPLDADGRPNSCNFSLLPDWHNFSTINADESACDSWDYDMERANYSVVSVWNLVCHRAWLLPAAEVVRASGAMLATLAAGYAADQAGRKPVIIAAATVLLLTTLSVPLSSSYLTYVLMNAILAGSAGALFAITTLLSFELGTNAKRARQICVAVMFGYAPVTLLYMELCKTRFTWKQRQMIMVSPSSLAPLFYVFVVESPRWLVATKQFTRAEEAVVVARVTNNFVKDVGGVSIMKRLRGMAGPRVESLRAMLIAVLGIPVVQRRAAIVFISSFAVTFTFHVLKPIAGFAHSPNDWASFTAEAILLGVLLLVLKPIQRLVTLSANLSLLASCSCLASLAFRIGDETFGGVCLVLARGLSLTGMTVNYVYVLELFPTALRGIFFCTSYTFGLLGAAFAGFLEMYYDPNREDYLLGIVVLVTFNAVLLLVHITEPNEAPCITSTAEPPHPKRAFTIWFSIKLWLQRFPRVSQRTRSVEDKARFSDVEVVAAGNNTSIMTRNLPGSHIRATTETDSLDKRQTMSVVTKATDSFSKN